MVGSAGWEAGVESAGGDNPVPMGTPLYTLPYSASTFWKPFRELWNRMILDGSKVVDAHGML